MKSITNTAHTLYYLNKTDVAAIHAGDWTLLQHLQGMPLHLIDGADESGNVDAYAMYSSKALYVWIVSKQDTLVNKDRAYQNGDGFHFVIGTPHFNHEKTNEFHVIGVSPLCVTPRRVFEWYRNVDLSGTPLRNADVKHQLQDGVVKILAIIPWTDLTPIKPILWQTIAFNISYVRAVDEQKLVWILEDDEGIQSEQRPRGYCCMEFESKLPQELELIVEPSSINGPANKPMHLRIGSNASSPTWIHSKISLDGITVSEIRYEAPQGNHIEEVELPAALLAAGKHCIHMIATADHFECNKQYFIRLYSTDQLDILKYSIQSKINFEDPYLYFSHEALIFLWNDFERSLSELKPYESYKPLATKQQKLVDSLFRLQSGKHLFERGKKLRLGFQSDQDRTFQPFSLYIPKSVQDNRFQGLMICLHGSGSNDHHALGPIDYRLAEETGLILAAPFARGTSHAYCQTEALVEIGELTQKLQQLFQLQDTKTILQGFSMGGYGVLRAYDHSPELFEGLAIFSGHPDLSPHFDCEPGPNYQTDENLSIFSSVPMACYHGTKDLNCDYKQVGNFYHKLTNLNPALQITISDCGHEGLHDEWYDSFKSWILKLIP